jgi:parvulin-like peptidyl-prolyl cis-trans isomerase-like protein
VKRLPALVAALAVLALIGGFIAYRSNGSGAPAFTVNGHSVSQSDVDDELRALANNAAFASVIRQQQSAPLSSHPGSISSNYAALWVTFRVSQVFVDDTVTRRHLTVTGADRAAGQALAAQFLGSPQVVRSLPSSFRGALEARFARIAVVRRLLVTQRSAQLTAAALAACPSHRFVAHILVASLADAQAVQAQLAAGADFATLAGQRSIDRVSGAQGGELGCLDSQSFVAAFQQVAQTQPIGVVSDPVQSQFGFHLVLVRDQPSAPDLANLALSEVLGLARGAGVTVDPRYGSWDRRNGRVVPPQPLATSAATPSPTG